METAWYRIGVGGAFIADVFWMRIMPAAGGLIPTAGVEPPSSPPEGPSI